MEIRYLQHKTGAIVIVIVIVIVIDFIVRD